MGGIEQRDRLLTHFVKQELPRTEINNRTGGHVKAQSLKAGGLPGYKRHSPNSALVGWQVDHHFAVVRREYRRVRHKILSLSRFGAVAGPYRNIGGMHRGLARRKDHVLLKYSVPRKRPPSRHEHVCRLERH